MFHYYSWVFGFHFFLSDSGANTAYHKRILDKIFIFFSPDKKGQELLEFLG